MGAWIEIIAWALGGEKYKPSLPSWERGLKLDKLEQMDLDTLVAPLVGAWIEIGSIANLFTGGR